MDMEKALMNVQFHKMKNGCRFQCQQGTLNAEKSLQSSTFWNLKLDANSLFVTKYSRMYQVKLVEDSL